MFLYLARIPTLLLRPRAIRERGYPEASVRIALISDPGEDPVPPAKASGRRVARESPVHVSMRKRHCVTVIWPFFRKRTMGPIRLLPRWWIIATCVSSVSRVCRSGCRRGLGSKAGVHPATRKKRSGRCIAG